jgi:hypothetical protein
MPVPRLVDERSKHPLILLKQCFGGVELNPVLKSVNKYSARVQNAVYATYDPSRLEDHLGMNQNEDFV